MHRILTAVVAGLSLGGCVTKPITLDCAEFRTRYAVQLPRSPTIQEIQRDAVVKPPAIAATLGQENPPADQRDALVALIASTLNVQPMVTSNNLPTDQTPNAGSPPKLLALSGGGQWGAFGAAYLRALASKNPTELPNFQMITGVSTGALQALFVGANQPETGEVYQFLETLTLQYAPASEAEIVDRGGYAGALFKGSVAKLGPLRARIEKALCPDLLDATVVCPLIEQLGAADAPTVLLGFVEASSGQMQTVNITLIAQDALNRRAAGEVAAMKTAQQCITGGALASVAMPFFYQQVQIRSSEKLGAEPVPMTYYDGGVRNSIFLEATVEANAAIIAQQSPTPAALANNRAGPDIYVVRNGPTVARPEPGIDQPSGAIPSAERGYSLIVNQSEIMAIEAIRLRHPMSEMWLATADGYDREFVDPDAAQSSPVKIRCSKSDKSAMFEPQFMRCLQAFGRYKAAMTQDGAPAGGWIVLTKP